MINLKRKSLHFFEVCWPYLLIVFIVVSFFWKFFLKGLIPIPGDFIVGVYYPWLDYKWGYAVGVPVQNPILTDVVSFTYPMQTLAVDLLKSGKLPLWNPLILGGTPLLANFQSSPFSPTNFIYFLTDNITAWGFQIVLQHFFAAVFTFILLRHWKISKFGSVLGSVVYAFGGFNLIWSQWNGHTLAAAFIPLILFFSDNFLLKQKWVYGVGVSVSLALMMLSGYPQIILYLGLSVFVLWFVRIWRGKGVFKKSFFLASFFLIGFGLSAFQIIPGAELLKYSQREVELHPFEWAFLPVDKVITFIAPNYFGNHATRNYWGPQDYTSNTGFVGVIAFILAGYSLLIVKKKKEILVAFFLLVVSLILAFPTPISMFLWKSGIGGFNAASAHRSLVIFNLAMAILSGFGFDYLLSGELKKRFWIGFLVPGTLLVVFIVVAFLAKGNTLAGTSIRVVALRNLAIPCLVFLLAFLSVVVFHLNLKIRFVKVFIAFMLFALMVVEVFNFGWKFTPFSDRKLIFPKTPVLDFLMSQEKPFRVTGDKVVPINMRMPYKLESLEGYDAVYPLSISKFIAAVNTGHTGTTPLGRYGTVDDEFSSLLPFVNVKYTIAIKKDKKGNPDANGVVSHFFDPKIFKQVFEDKTTVVLENVNTLPRAFVVFDWDVATNKSEALNKIVSNDFPRDRRVVLLKDPGIKKSLDGKFNADVRYLHYGEEESLIDVDSPKEGILFVSDTFFPGWKAYIDGKETEILQADYAFRGVVVPEGKHVVKFIYRPDSFFRGVKISLLSLVALVGLIGYTLLIRKKNVKGTISRPR